MQASTSHTPGPWKAQRPSGPQHAIDRKWEIVSPLKDGGEMIVVGEHTGVECLTEANARLIAAAPELLEALRECITEDGATCLTHAETRPDWLQGRIHAVSNIARSAIAKAEGRAE